MNISQLKNQILRYISKSSPLKASLTEIDSFLAPTTRTFLGPSLVAVNENIGFLLKVKLS